MNTIKNFLKRFYCYIAGIVYLAAFTIALFLFLTSMMITDLMMKYGTSGSLVDKELVFFAILFVIMAIINKSIVTRYITVIEGYYYGDEMDDKIIIVHRKNGPQIYKGPIWEKNVKSTIINLPEGWSNILNNDVKIIKKDIKLGPLPLADVSLLTPIEIYFVFSGPFVAEELMEGLKIELPSSLEPQIILLKDYIDNLIEYKHGLAKDTYDFFNETISKNLLMQRLAQKTIFPNNFLRNIKETIVYFGEPEFKVIKQ